MMHKNNTLLPNKIMRTWNLLQSLAEKHLCKISSWRPKQTVSNKPARPNKPGKYDSVRIMLTMTTCKRIDLFQRTMRSILNTWTNLNLVDHWLVVDDNSSDGDRKRMREEFPWIRFVWKTPDQAGHRTSMNLIFDELQRVGPEYWVHLEDDFLFHQRLDYVGHAIAAFNALKDHNVAQVLFSNNYAETQLQWNLRGSIWLGQYAVHNHHKNAVNYPNCHYWPHYSFRPSVVKVETILALGNFDSPNVFFERDYANKYEAAGLKSAFFQEIPCTHIGKLTNESGTNAYILNAQSQFDSNKAKP
jgi:hypothetical protein